MVSLKCLALGAAAFTTISAVPVANSQTLNLYKFQPRDLESGQDSTVREYAELVITGTHSLSIRGEHPPRASWITAVVVVVADGDNTSDNGMFSYSWARTDNQGFGEDGNCSIISLLDGVVVDTMAFGPGKPFIYEDREFPVGMNSRTPVFSVDLRCEGKGATRVDVAIRNVSFGARRTEELRRR